MTENGPDGGSMDRPGTPPDLLAERFGDPEKDRFGDPHSQPDPWDGMGPTWWWEREQIRKTAANNLRTLAEEVASNGSIRCDGARGSEPDRDGRG